MASVICANLRLDPHIASAPATAGLWQIGRFKPLAGYEFPLFMRLNLTPLDSRPVIEWLGLATEGPFILFGPTSRRLRPSDHALLKRRGACFIPLEDCLMISDANEMSLLAESHHLLLRFQQSHVPVANDEPTIEFFPTPAGAKWSDLKLRFVDGETLSVSILGVDGRFGYSQMGFVNKKTARPNYQWELLRDFAQCGGKITWSDPAADLSIPWQIIVVFALWLAAWLGGWLRASRRKLGESERVAMPGELLLAGSATAMIANGVVMILFSRVWSHGTGPDPIRTLFWLALLFLLLTLGAAATIFYRPMRRRILYWLLSLLILGAVFTYNFYVMAQTIASV